MRVRPDCQTSNESGSLDPPQVIQLRILFGSNANCTRPTGLGSPAVNKNRRKSGRCSVRNLPEMVASGIIHIARTFRCAINPTGTRRMSWTSGGREHSKDMPIEVNYIMKETHPFALLAATVVAVTKRSAFLRSSRRTWPS